MKLYSILSAKITTFKSNVPSQTTVKRVQSINKHKSVEDGHQGNVCSSLTLHSAKHEKDLIL